MEEKLYEWFGERTIALVGNSKSLIDKNYGEIIDTYDIVCRINRAFHMLPNRTKYYSKNIGSKTDVFFINQVRTCGIRPLEVEKYIVIQTTPSPVQGSYRKHVDLVMSKEFFSRINRNFSEKPSTGMRALLCLDAAKAKQVDVYGFDWKQSHPSFYGRSSDWGRKGHNFKEEKDYCMKNIFTKENFNWIE